MEFPKAGVKVWFLLGEFVDDVAGGIDVLRGMKTAQVFQDIIKPKTLCSASSYCDMLRDQGHPAYGKRSTVFISHVHDGYYFVDLISALRYKLRDEPETVVWIDLFSINQHCPMDWTFDWLSTTFRSAIQDIGRTIMVMSPWDDPQPFTRAWCIFEAFCTADTDAVYEIALSEPDEAKFLQDIMDTTTTHDNNNINNNKNKNTLTKMNEMLSTIRADKCQCSVPSDKEFIFAVIEATVGFSKLDAMVLERYREWVLRVSIQALENESYKGGTNEEDDNMKTLALLEAIGTLFQIQGKYCDSQAYFQKCVNASKDVLGEDHPDVVTRQCLLGNILRKRGMYEEASIWIESSLATNQKLHGDHHPSTLFSMNQLAALRYSQEVFDEAAELYGTTYEARRALLGDKHHKTLHSMKRYAAALSNQGSVKDDEARVLLEACLERQVDVLGSDHPKALNTSSHLSKICYNLGDYERAETLAKSCFQRQTAALGPDHPHTLLSMSRLAAILHQRGNVEEARQLKAACLERQITTLGEDHPQTLFTKRYELGSVRL